MANLKFIVVGLEDKGLRLDKFLAIYFSNIPYSIIQKKIRLGIFMLNGKKISPNSKLLHGDKVYYKDNLAVKKKIVLFIKKYQKY